jgi:hypothetical protein
MQAVTIRCYFCGVDQKQVWVEDNSDLVLEDNRLWTFDACEECVKDMRYGVILMESVEGDMGDNPKRTGRRLVLPEEFIQSTFNPVMVSAVMRTRFVFVMEFTFTMLKRMWDESKS